MCALAHVLEREGIATVAIVTKARVFPEKMRPPRVLFCAFPLGRPLGKPRDAEFQRDVLTTALGLLAAEEPVLHDYLVTVDDGLDMPLACAIPPVVEAGLLPSVGEARGLREAFARGGGDGIAMAINPGFVEGSLVAFERTAAGTPWREAGFPASPQRCALAIRGYYEQAAIGLAHTPGGARAAEAWFVNHTIAGATLKAALASMRASGEPGNAWGILISTLQDH